MDDQSFDVNWDDVQLVPQLTNMSCWAAAAAMIIGWRDSVSIDPSDVATGTGVWAAYTNGLNPTDVPTLANAWGLIMEPPQSYSIDGLRQLLASCGPLWVAAAVPGLHAIVVTGMYGDGSVGDTYVRINDPWGRDPGAPGSPGPYDPTPGQGSRYVLSLTQFSTEYQDAPTNNPNINIQILHCNGKGAS